LRGFGAKAVVKDLDFGGTEEYTLVGAGDDDIDSGRINITSPLAQGLVGHKQREVVEIDVPAGKRRIEIVEISYEA
jgi:transcription elongation factor GreA